MNSWTRHHPTPLRVAAIAALVGVTTLAACGDDESAQDRYCEAGDDLESSIAALVGLDLLAEGTSGLEGAVDDVRADVEEMRESADDAVADDVAALDESIDDLNDALGAVGDDLSEANVDAFVAAIGDVQAAFGAVGDTLADC